MRTRWARAPDTFHALEHKRVPGATRRHAAVPSGRDNHRHPGSRPAVSDSYYEVIDATDELGEKFIATDMVRSTWSAAIQHAAPVSALLVRGLERCEQRGDTRLSRVMVDLLGPVPAEGDLWVRTQRERTGKQTDMVTAEMLAPGPASEPRPVARASGWRLQKLVTPGVVHASAPPLRPVADAWSRDMKKNWDRNYVHSVY